MDRAMNSMLSVVFQGHKILIGKFSEVFTQQACTTLNKFEKQQNTKCWEEFTSLTQCQNGRKNYVSNLMKILKANFLKVDCNS